MFKISLPQRGRGTTAVVDEEIGIYTADMTGLQIILIKIEIFASAKINLHFAAGKLSLERSKIIILAKQDYHSREARLSFLRSEIIILAKRDIFPFPLAFSSVL